jgi:tRNA modification GTPase
LTRVEHRDAVLGALVHLKRAIGAASEDLFAADVRNGLSALAPLIGETVPDDILGRIFSSFCIGK